MEPQERVKYCSRKEFEEALTDRLIGDSLDGGGVEKNG